MDLSGKTVVITGATSGIGLAAVRAFVRAGAFVIGVGRSEVRNQQTKGQILKDFPGAQLHYLLADLASLDQVRSLAGAIKALLSQHGIQHLDVLINNAGTYLGKKHLTEDGIETTFAVNHLAHFLLSHDLLPELARADDGRILSVSSYSHRTTPLTLSRITNPWPYISLLAYKRSKLCNVLFTYEINRRCKGVTAFAVDPGLVNTEIASKGSRGISHWVWRRRKKQGTSTDIPVKTMIYLAFEDQVDLSQGYYFKDSEPKKPSVNARRADLAARLWELSCHLTKTNWHNC